MKKRKEIKTKSGRLVYREKERMRERERESKKK